MPSTIEIVKDLKDLEPNGVPVALEIANKVGFSVPVVPNIDYFNLETDCIDVNSSLLVTALPSVLDRHALSRDCTVVGMSSESEDEIIKSPLSIWMAQLIDSAGIKLSDSAKKLMVDNTGAIFRHRIDLVYSRLGVKNG